MNNFLTRLSLVTLLAVGLTFAGCAEDDNPVAGTDDDVSGTQSLDTLDLDDEFGGLSYSDEPAAFGDDDLLAAMTMDEAAALSEDEEDSLLDDDPSLEGPRFRRTFVKILWGQLDGDFDPTADRTEFDAVDWSGSIKVTEGVLAMKRTILFEKPYDHRLPRASRDSLAWVSRTGPHFDGLVVCVLSPVEDDVALGDLIIDMPLFDATISVDALDGYEELTSVDENGNAVSIRAEVFEPVGCGKGFLGGFWKNTRDLDATAAVEMGVFRGRYVGQNGVTTGFLHGMYGLNSQGERVMAGKVVNRNGRILGLIGGTWEPGEAGDGMGTFQARWVNRRGLRLGVLGGTYQENRPDEAGDGFFEGRWQEICSQDRS